MAIAGTLAVNILARTKQFEKGIKTARSSLRGFGKSIKSITKGVSGFGAALVGAAGLAGFGAFAASTLKSIDTLAKTSDKLGISTENLGKWRFAADKAGIASNTLDLAFQRMVRRIGQASLGTGEAKKTLDRFGLSAKELVRLDPSEQFRLIGENINAITNKGEQLAAAMSIFDTEGVGLVNLFASNIGEAATEFERLGLAVSRADAAKIEEFNDATSKLKQTLSAAGRDFVIGITPAALKAVEGLQVLVEDIRGLGRGGLAEKGSNLSAVQIGGADILRGIAGGRAPPLADSVRRQHELERELAGPRLTPEEFKEANKKRAEALREQRRQTQILRETLEVQRRAVLDRTTVILEPATF